MKMHLSIEKIMKVIPLFFDINALQAIARWSKFSITAYTMVSLLLKQGIRPRTLIDVGANVGQFSVAALNIFKGVHVHAFEPIESCVNKLRLNTSKYSNVHIHAVALSAKQERADFHINAYSLASSLLRLSNKHQAEFSKVAEKQTVSIEVSTLDHFFSDADLLAPVLLKIDVQGAEKFVLEGGKETLKSVDYVILETSFTKMYEGETLFLDIIELMKSYGFQFIRPIDFLKSPNSREILQADILFKKQVSTGGPIGSR